MFRNIEAQCGKQRPRQNTMCQTPPDTGTLTWPRTIVKVAGRFNDAALNVLPQVMFVTTPYAAGEGGCGYESAQPQQRRRALASAAPPPMRRFGGGGGGDSTLTSMFFFSFEAATGSTSMQCVSPVPSSSSLRHLEKRVDCQVAAARCVVRVAAPRRIWGPHFFFLFSRARRVMGEEKNRIVT